MELKVFSLILLFIIAIKCIESKKPVRTFLVVEDWRPEKKPLTEFTVYDSSEKNRLYLIRTIFTDLDTIIRTDYRAKKIVGNVEGEWTNRIFNVSLSIYDKTSDEWIDGTMGCDRIYFTSYFSFLWNGEKVVFKSYNFSKTIKICKQMPGPLVAQFRYRSLWRSVFIYKYDLKIYDTNVPDVVFLLGLTIIHHNEQLPKDNMWC
ncbi:unnamed protein product [Adineta steineri]|uniref:Uncharacterized protein n=1 Tax=Adineta steineri TaxID=433720 RepID=A0A813PEU1_9BILA|nr:unnamed protein product [Adineta steineri]CAF3680962.1 unnamed protein product [Adineta steineri]